MNKTVSCTRKAFYVALFLAGVVLVFYKCRFGYADMDESFYLTIPYRLTMGDGLFVNEWHLSQMAGFLIYPFMAIYRILFPTGEGIILHFRYLYTALHTITALLIWWRLKKYGGWALSASLLYLLFTPYGIMALSYNSMGVAFVTLSGVFLATNFQNRKRIWVIAGMFWAAAVLCCPYLVGGYLIFAVGCLVAWLLAKNRENLNALLWVTVGCAALAIVFIAFVFSRASLTELMAAFPEILNDPEHPPVSFADTSFLYFLYISRCNKWSPVILSVSVVLIIAILLDRRPSWRQWLYGMAAILLSVCLAVPFVIDDPSLNTMMFPMAYLGLFAFLFAPKQNWRLFVFLWVSGAIYGFCVNWTSNQGFGAISMASVVSAVGSCIMVGNWVEKWRSEIPNEWVVKALKFAAIGFVAVFLLLEGKIRYSTLFWEHGGMADMTRQIQTGPEKGIWVSEKSESAYLELLSDITPVVEWEEGPVLYYTVNTISYLCDKKDMGTFSAWTSGTGENSFAKLQTYYQLNPDKFPKAVYCQKTDEFAVEALRGWLEPIGYQCNETKNGLMFYVSD